MNLRGLLFIESILGIDYFFIFSDFKGFVIISLKFETEICC